MSITGKQKGREGPRKLTKFFTSVPGRPIQDGASAERRSPSSTMASSLNPPCRSAVESPDTGHPQPSSDFSSLVKQKSMLGEEGDDPDDTDLVGEDMEEASAYQQPGCIPNYWAAHHRHYHEKYVINTQRGTST